MPAAAPGWCPSRRSRSAPPRPRRSRAPRPAGPGPHGRGLLRRHGHPDVHAVSHAHAGRERLVQGHPDGTTAVRVRVHQCRRRQQLTGPDRPGDHPPLGSRSIGAEVPLAGLAEVHLHGAQVPGRDGCARGQVLRSCPVRGGLLGGGDQRHDAGDRGEDEHETDEEPGIPPAGPAQTAALGGRGHGRGHRMFPLRTGPSGRRGPGTPSVSAPPRCAQSNHWGRGSPDPPRTLWKSVASGCSRG